MQEFISQSHVVGSVRKQLFDENGICIYDHTDHNLEVTVGKVYEAAWLAAGSQAGPFMSYVGLGTGTTPPVIADTNLQTPLPTRVQGTLSSLSNVWQNVATFPAGINTGSVTEAGLFSSISGGTMFARNVFSLINKGALNSLIVTWQVTFL